MASVSYGKLSAVEMACLSHATGFDIMAIDKLRKKYKFQ